MSDIYTHPDPVSMILFDDKDTVLKVLYYQIVEFDNVKRKMSPGNRADVAEILLNQIKKEFEKIGVHNN